jgi:hypothetical protein
LDLLITRSEAAMTPTVECAINQAINPAVVFAELGDEAVLLNTDSGVYFGLDGVGTRIWTLLAEGMSEEQIHAQLLTEYAVDADQLGRDIAHLLRRLQDGGLLTRPTSA